MYKEIETKGATPLSHETAVELLREQCTRSEHVVSLHPIPPQVALPSHSALMEARGLIRRFKQRAALHPEDFEGDAGIRAIRSVLSGVRRLGIPFEKLKVSEEKLQRFLASCY